MLLKTMKERRFMYFMTPKTVLVSALLGALGGVAAMAQTNLSPLPAPSTPGPDFQEVYQILSTNLEGIKAAELDRAAAQ